MYQVESTPNDDPAFIEIVSYILLGSVICYQPREVYAIQIDRRFDRKWLYFSGKVMGALGIWSASLRIPPFVPERILSQRYFQIDPTASNQFSEVDAKPIHIHQSGSDNQTRLLRQLSSSGLFLWYSGKSLKDGVASVMVYRADQERELAWYISYIRTDNWKIESVSGISRHTFDEIMDLAKEKVRV